MLRRSLVLALGAMGALAFWAAPALAQNAHWDPPNQDISAESGNSILEYDGETVECDISQAQANTNDDGSGGNTDMGLLNDLTFGTAPGFNDCQASVGDVDEITTDGFDWELNALQATGGGDGVAEVVSTRDPDSRRKPCISGHLRREVCGCGLCPALL